MVPPENSVEEKKGSWSYCLVTPTRNEEDYFESVIESVAKQTKPPLLWLIVDNSLNGYPARLLQSHPRLGFAYRILRKSGDREYDWLRIGALLREGLDYAEKWYTRNDFTVENCAILDADMNPKPSCFQILGEHLQTHPDVGVVSGLILVEQNSVWIPESTGSEPRGAIRMFKCRCLRDIGGFPETPSPETVSDMKARSRGWKTEVVGEAECFGLRRAFSGSDPLQAFRKFGRGRYILDYHPVPALVTGGLIALKRGPSAGVGYLLGYSTGWWKDEEKVSDPEVRRHFRVAWKSETLSELMHTAIRYITG